MLTTASLLCPGKDPDPVERIDAAENVPVLLVCEHAGQHVPAALQGLGVPRNTLDLHVGWDVGAAAVTRAMASELGCSAILQRYSRLVIDCNRPANAPDSIPEVSDGVIIPGNQALADHAREARVAEIFKPFDIAVTEARRAGPRLLLSIHSFTPMLQSEPRPRPWHLGFLCRKDTRTSTDLMQSVARLRPDMTLALNEPYQIDSASDWFVPEHGEASGLPHSLIEIRHDLIRDAAGQARIARLLCESVRNFLEAKC